MMAISSIQNIKKNTYNMDKTIPTYFINFDPEKFESGIDLIAVTETPAIETLSLRFSEQAKHKFSYIEDQQIIIGPAIIPDKPIYRYENGREFYVIFRREVIEQMIEKFNSELRSVKFNIEHDENFLVEGFIKESWIVEDEEIDKSRIYGFNVPVGTWMISAKITDKQIWDSVIKQMDNVGFSIEGLMGVQTFSKQEFESYDDYPKAASANAQRALDWAAENGWGSCGTPVGKARANQLAKGEKISEDTIKRMAAFIRHQGSKGTPYGEGCGKLMWDAWGGDEGIAWAQRKIDQINKEKENLSTTDEENKNKPNKMKKENKKSRFFATKLNTKKKFNASTKRFEEVLISEEEEVLIVEEIAEGAAVEMLDDNGEIVAAEDGTYVIESEEIQVEVADGEIVEIEEIEVVEEAAEMAKEEEEEKENYQIDAEMLAKIVELESRIEALEAAMATEAADEAFTKTKFSKDASKAARLTTIKNLLK